MSTATIPQGDKDLAIIRNYLIGGSLLGAGTAGATALINHFKGLNDRAEKAKATNFDDDVLYVNVPRRDKEASSWGADVAALSAFPVATLGSYALVQNIARKLKKRRLQSELDQTQNYYLKALQGGDEQEKLATAVEQPMSDASKMWALPGALALLTALGSGALTTRILDKQFPAPKRPQSAQPKRLVIRETPDELLEDEETMVKQQSFNDEAAECLLRNVLGLDEEARASGLLDLVKAAASGRTEEILLATDEDIETLEAVVKNASAPASEIRKDLAIGWLVRDPEMSDYVKLASALEFANTFPTFCQIARSAPEDVQDDLIKLAAYVNALSRATRYDYPETTEKFALAMLPDAIRARLEHGPAEDPSKELDVESGETATTNEQQSAPTNKSNASPTEAITDPVDGFFQSGAQSKPTPVGSGVLT